MFKVCNPKICKSNDVSIDIKEIIEKEVIFLKKSVKQFLAFAVLMTLVLALFTGCKNSEKTENLPAETSVKLWWAYNTENLMQEYLLV